MCVTINLSISFAVLEFPTSLSISNVLLLAAMVRSLGHVGGLPCMLTTQHTGLILGWDRHPKCLPHISPICTLGWQFPHPLLFQYPRIFNFSPHPNWVNYTCIAPPWFKYLKFPNLPVPDNPGTAGYLQIPPPPPLTDSVKLRDCVNQRWRFNLCSSS